MGKAGRGQIAQHRARSRSGRLLSSGHKCLLLAFVVLLVQLLGEAVPVIVHRP